MAQVKPVVDEFEICYTPAISASYCTDVDYLCLMLQTLLDLV